MEKASNQVTKWHLRSLPCLSKRAQRAPHTHISSSYPYLCQVSEKTIPVAAHLQMSLSKWIEFPQHPNLHLWKKTSALPEVRQDLGNQTTTPPLGSLSQPTTLKDVFGFSRGQSNPGIPGKTLPTNTPKSPPSNPRLEPLPLGSTLRLTAPGSFNGSQNGPRDPGKTTPTTC